MYKFQEPVLVKSLISVWLIGLHGKRAKRRHRSQSQTSFIAKRNFFFSAFPISPILYNSLALTRGLMDGYNSPALTRGLMDGHVTLVFHFHLFF